MSGEGREAGTSTGAQGGACRMVGGGRGVHRIYLPQTAPDTPTSPSCSLCLVLIGYTADRRPRMRSRFRQLMPVRRSHDWEGCLRKAPARTGRQARVKVCKARHAQGIARIRGEHTKRSTGPQSAKSDCRTYIGRTRPRVEACDELRLTAPPGQSRNRRGHRASISHRSRSPRAACA